MTSGWTCPLRGSAPAWCAARTYHPAVMSGPEIPVVRSESIEALLVEALCGLVDYVETRDASCTDDDDVRALEDVAFVLHRVAAEERQHLIDLLGPRMSFEIGLTDVDPGQGGVAAVIS